MLLLDGGGKAVLHVNPVAKPAPSVAKKAAATYRLNITGERIADFDKTGITLNDGQTLNFTVFPKDSMLLTAFVENMNYVSTVSNLEQGVATNDNAVEAIMSAIAFIYGDMVFILESVYGDKIYRYDRSESGELTPAGELTMPSGSMPCYIRFVNEEKAYISLYLAGKIVVINPTAMTITKEIDLSGYAVGDDDNNPEPTEMVIRDGKMFVGLHQNISMYSAHPSAYVLIVDVATDTVEKMITDERTCHVGWRENATGIFVDDIGDLYLYGVAVFGYQPGVKDGFLRIKKGETEFDPDYFFCIQDMSLPDVPENKGTYIYNMVYTGGSTLYGFIMIPALMSDPPDYVKDRNYQPFKIDLAAKTAEKIELSPSNGWAHGVCGYDNKVVFGISSVDGDGLYTYDPKTGAVSSMPVVTTEGAPLYIMAF